MTKGEVVAKKSLQADRQARVEQMRAAQKAKDRRTTILVAVAAGAVVVVLIGLVFVTVRNYREDHPDPVSLVGVGAGAASCGDVETDPATGVNQHVGPGTPTPDDHVDQVRQRPADARPALRAPRSSRPAVLHRGGPAGDGDPGAQPRARLHRDLVPGGPAEGAAGRAEDRSPTSPATLDETGGKFVVSAWDERIRRAARRQAGGALALGRRERQAAALRRGLG